jgi:hypothetical protein
MVTRELSESPVWFALTQHPKAMAAYWFLVGQLHQNAGNQDDGLVCPRRQFKKWCGGQGDGVGRHHARPRKCLNYRDAESITLSKKRQL